MYTCIYPISFTALLNNTHVKNINIVSGYKIHNNKYDIDN